MGSEDAAGPVEPLLDRFGRVHTYLRLSVTDRCNFRCRYCMPEQGIDWMPRANLLSYEETARLVGIFAGLGIQRVRLTGGEPTIRRDIEALIREVASTPGIVDVAMTTNATRLGRIADSLARAGLTRVNVSLDTLRPDLFRELTRGGDLLRVLEGIEAAREAGLVPMKINAVILQGKNEDELFEIVDYFAPHADDTVLRFIEYMPFEDRTYRTVPSRLLRERLAERHELKPDRASEGAGPARYMRLDNGLLVGFISPLSEHFCATCNRLRLMADGHLRTCLAHEDTPSLLRLIRGNASDDELQAAIRAMVMGKPAGHDCQTDGGSLFQGAMTSVGG